MTTLAEAPVAATTTWAIDPVHSQVEFSVRHMMVSNVKGRFGQVAGTIESNGERVDGAAVDVSIDAASITTGNEQRDAHLRSADFLDVENFPAISFAGKQIVNHGNGAFDLIGDLTIRGVSREVVVKAVDNGRGTTPYGQKVAGFSGTTEFSRKDFGVEYNMALETGGFVVGDTIKVTLEIELTRQDG